MKHSRSSSIYIGVGSNIDPEKNITKALLFLLKKVAVLESSTFFWTEALERPNQDRYLNGVWKITSHYSPEELKNTVLSSIENQLHRIRTDDKYAPRTIDLDILLYISLIVQKKTISIFDKEIYSRSFIAVPLQELEPNLILPDTKQTISDIVSSMKTASMRKNIEMTDILRSIIQVSQEHD